MLDQLTALIVNEGIWLPVSMGFALLAVGVLLYRHRHSSLPVRRRVLAAMTRFCGVTLGIMAIGHVLAVTTKLADGTLKGSVPLPLLYLIGVALAAPSWGLVYHTRRVLAAEDHGRWTLILNAWLAITLAALGVHNLPLAALPFLNLVYHVHSRPAVGWAIVSLAVVVNLGLFIGSLIFLASGLSFEEFSGMQ